MADLEEICESSSLQHYLFTCCDLDKKLKDTAKKYVFTLLFLLLVLFKKSDRKHFFIVYNRDGEKCDLRCRYALKDGFL